MKRIITGIVSAALAAILVFCLAGCSKYVARYAAVGYVHSETSRRGDMTFASFEGAEVFKFRSDREQDSVVFNATLESGRMTVYVDCGDGSKRELFTLSSGGHTEGSGEIFTVSGPIYVIVETDGKCENGKLCVILASGLATSFPDSSI